MNHAYLMVESLRQRLEYGETVKSTEERAGSFVVHLSGEPPVSFDLDLKGKVEEILQRYS
jgi:hypothetical protein